MFLQYHNFAKLKYLPYRYPPFSDGDGGVYTRVSTAERSVGQRLFLILGAGKPKRTFYLWESFTVDDVTRDGDEYHVHGHGWMLNPPVKLQGAEFKAFQKACGDFVGFRPIEDLQYSKQLAKFADTNHRGVIDKELEAFCTDFLEVSRHQEAAFLRAFVRHRLGNTDGAR